MDDSKKPVTSRQFAVNALWKILEQFSAKGVSMIVSIILARILLPQDYGIIALTAVFTNLSDILIDGGFSTALIRKETVDDHDYSAVFSISILMATVLYTALFFSAPFISSYYSEPQLIPVVRVIGLTFFLQSFTAVRNGIINRRMQFKLLFMCNTTASILSGVLGIILALMGVGVWALVAQRLSQVAILNLLLFAKVKWKVRLRFDFARIRSMLSFSIGVVGSTLISYISDSIFSVVIGKRYSVTDLGYYDKGGQLPRQLSLYTFSAMSTVLLPTLSLVQNDLPRFKRIVRKTTSMTSFLIIPLMCGMILTSREIIVLLLTEKWIKSVPIMQCICVYYIALPYTLINVQAYFAMGKSGMRVRLELIKMFLMMGVLLVFGVLSDSSLAILSLASSVVMIVVAMLSYLYIRRIIDYSVAELFNDMWKPIVSTAVMSAGILLTSVRLPLNSYLVMFICKVAVGTILYLICSVLLKSDDLHEALSLLRRKKNE